MKINLRPRLTKKRAAIIGLAALPVICGVLIFTVIKAEASREANRVEAFEAEKASKLAAIVDENTKIKEEAAKKEQSEHESLQKLIDSGSLTTANVQSDCGRLRNRETVVITNKYSCTYNMRAKGTAKMAVVFVTDNPAIDYSQDLARYKGPQSSQDSLNYVNEFFKREAARKNNPNLNIQIEFYGPFAQVSPITGNNYNLENTQEIVDALQNTSLENNVPEKNYDLVHYVHLQKGGFRSFALSGDHRAFTSASWGGTTGVFIHETLHLFGATDKYNNNDCLTRGRGDPFNPNSSESNLTDIMCSSYAMLDYLNINTITAREIGWLN